MSRIKLISILLDMEQYGEALEQCIEGFTIGTEGNTFDLLARQFALCCSHLQMTEEAVRTLVENRLSPCVKTEELVQAFLGMEHKPNQAKSGDADNADPQDEKRIAQYGELAIALFEDLIKSESRDLSRHDLIMGYERILNYCKHVGLKGEVADQCINRIAQLSAEAGEPSACESSAVTEALKIYLGQVLPMSGEYDVFLSYKSEDEALAKKLYEYLTQSGKEVFFSRETLPQLGESEYKEMIFEAIDRSKHMVVVCSSPDYLKTKWVRTEWDTFDNELIDERKTGNLLLVLTDNIAADKGRLPLELRKREIIKMSEFRSRLLSYLR